MGAKKIHIGKYRFGGGEILLHLDGGKATSNLFLNQLAAKAQVYLFGKLPTKFLKLGFVWKFLDKDQRLYWCPLPSILLDSHE